MSFSIGQKVKITNTGMEYSGYTQWAERYLTNWGNSYNNYVMNQYQHQMFTVIRAEKHSETDGSRIIYGIQADDGKQFIMDAAGLKVVVEPTLAERLELFDRVRVSGFRFIVVTDHNGNKALLGDESGWVSPEDVAENAAIEIYERPIYTSDLFDFSIIGKLKWQSEKSVRKQELTEKIIKLQDELTEANEELAALN